MPLRIAARCTFAAALTLALSIPMLAQSTGMAGMAPQSSDKPLLSPARHAQVALGSATIDISYNSPSIRHRKIFGGLVPYGEVWRTGANPATTLVTSVDITIGTLSVPAGTYTLYTLPGEQQWLFIVNKQIGQWGTEYHQEQDLGRIPMQVAPAPSSPQEMMSLTFEKTTPRSTQLHVRWDTTDRYIPITLK
jgi:hypothetical protein